VKGRRWPRFSAPDFYRDDRAANLFGSDVVRHFRKLAPAGNGLAVVYSGPHTFSRQVGNVSHRVLVGVAICGEVQRSGMLATKRPSFSRSIIAQYQTLYMRPSLSRYAGSEQASGKPRDS